jgi:hypothetical protein
MDLFEVLGALSDTLGAGGRHSGLMSPRVGRLSAFLDSPWQRHEAPIGVAKASCGRVMTQNGISRAASTLAPWCCLLQFANRRDDTWRAPGLEFIAAPG